MKTVPFTIETHAGRSFGEKLATFWRKLGGGSLTIAAALHLAILLVGLIWVIRIIDQPAPPIGFLPHGKSGGGGERGVKSNITTRRPAAITPTNKPKRVIAEGATSPLIIPDPGDSFGEIATISSLTGGVRGLGGGIGNGRGPGIGNNPFGDGGNSTGIGMTPFGMADPSSGALVGAFYDLKQTPKRQPTNVSNEAAKEIIREFVTRGWNESQLHAKYFQAPRTLYQTKVYIPRMPADEAPKAFQCEREVQPGRWIVIYRGYVSPPSSGRYRFVGAGDDVMVVRFDGKTVLDHGYTSGTTGIDIYRNLSVFRGEAENKDLEKRLRGTLLKPPVTLYQYPTTKDWNTNIGGLGVGREFEARAGSSYPIEILISEIPGGLFGASLLIEETGAKYEKASTGAPILPIFRTSAVLPEPTTADNAPPYDPAGPIWKLVRTSGFHDV
jgi:hypothetical protein